MKTPIFILVVALLNEGNVIAQSNDDFHTFTHQNGSSIHARIVAYHGGDDRLWLENAGQKRVWVNTSIFCKDDHEYLQRWHDFHSVLLEPSLNISIEPKEGPVRYSGSLKNKRVQRRQYQNRVTIEKHSDIPISDFRVEYRFFVKDEAEGGGGKQYGGEFTVGNVTNRQSIAFTTAPINLVTEYDRERTTDLFGYSYDTVKSRNDRLLGVWLKVHGSSPNGIPVVRDICNPSNLYEKVIWQKTPIALSYLSKDNAKAKPSSSEEKTADL